MNFRDLALVLGLLAPSTAIAQDPPKAEKLDYVVERSMPFHMPFHSADNQGIALAIIDKVQSEMQEQENKIAADQKRAPRRIEFLPEEEMWYAETQLNADGYNGVTRGEVLEAIAGNEKFKNLTAKKAFSASMELQTPRYAYEDSDAPEKLSELLAKKAKEANTENSPIFQRMMKAKIAKSYGAKKVKTEEGRAVLITNEMIDRFAKDMARFYLPGQQIVSDTPDMPEAKPEPANEYIVDFTVKFESPLDAAVGKRYVELRALYNTITKEAEAPKTEQDKIYMLSLIAGDDGNVTGSELEAKVNSLKAKIADLRSREDKELPILDWGEITVSAENEVKGYLKVTMLPADKKRMRETAAKYGLSKGQELVWLANNYAPGAVKGEGSMTTEQADNAIKALDEKYAPKEDKK